METQPGTKPATAVANPTDDWYEHGFARVENSRKRGVSSMPLPYAQTLIKWASYVPGADLSGMLVLDPACGSGNTLIAATQALAARGRVRRWGAERVAQEIERCIWGLDPDPIACHVTDLRLRRMIAHIIPELPATRRKTLQLHIHQTDSLTLPADARFKLVITNPPLATARGVVVSYGGFESKTPPRDVWLRFLEQSMGLTAWGGALAIALPEAFLIKPSAAALRAELGQEWTLEHLAHVTGVFRSGPGTVLLLLRRTPPPPDAQVRWERIERLSLSRMAYLNDADAEDGEAAPEVPAERPRTIHSRAARSERRRDGTLPQTDIAAGRSPWRYALGETERAFLAKLDQPYGA
ncbi:MAG: N-6 DNA methylase, partial [Ktedonobacterales bacterium]|nr:N-6 DNA methylase [Ktedonobacterales bacterium]